MRSWHRLLARAAVAGATAVVVVGSFGAPSRAASSDPTKVVVCGNVRLDRWIARHGSIRTFVLAHPKLMREIAGPDHPLIAAILAPGGDTAANREALRRAIGTPAFKVLVKNEHFLRTTVMPNACEVRYLGSHPDALSQWLFRMPRSGRS